jgi:flagellar basal-body rod protein FlgB
MIDNRLYPAMEDRMDWNARRHQSLSNNIANIDTPGFHSKDVSFSEQLQLLQVQTTSSKHIAPAGMDSRLQQYEVAGHADMKETAWIWIAKCRRSQRTACNTLRCFSSSVKN